MLCKTLPNSPVGSRVGQGLSLLLRSRSLGRNVRITPDWRCWCGKSPDLSLSSSYWTTVGSILVSTNFRKLLGASPTMWLLLSPWACWNRHVQTDAFRWWSDNFVYGFPLLGCHRSRFFAVTNCFDLSSGCGSHVLFDKWDSYLCCLLLLASCIVFRFSVFHCRWIVSCSDTTWRNRCPWKRVCGNMLRLGNYVHIKQHRYITERGVDTSQASMESSRYTYFQQSQCTRR